MFQCIMEHLHIHKKKKSIIEFAKTKGVHTKTIMPGFFAMVSSLWSQTMNNIKLIVSQDNERFYDGEFTGLWSITLLHHICWCQVILPWNPETIKENLGLKHLSSPFSAHWISSVDKVLKSIMEIIRVEREN